MKIIVVFLINVLSSVCLAQSSNPSNGNHNQSAGTNNGVMNQFNITIAPPLAKSLKRRTEEDFGSDRGWLRTITPASDQIPEDKDCQTPKGNLTVLLGAHGSRGTCSGEHCGILSDSDPQAINPDLLSVDRKRNSLQINAVILDQTGKVVAVVDKNQTHANPNNAFDWRRPDDHTIDIVDQYNRHVLHVRFANVHTIIVEGVFRFSDGRKLTITDDKMVDQFHNTMSGMCSTNAARSAFAF